MIKITEDMMNRYVLIRLHNNKGILCQIVKVVEGIVVTKTNRIGKIPLSKIRNIRVIETEEELKIIKRSFGLW